MDDARRLQLLWDKLAIDQLMLRFGRALDLHDWEAYRACFADRVEIDFGDLLGRGPKVVDADAWTAFARAALEPVTCLHRYTNHLVTVKGDAAESVLYMEACHFLGSAGGTRENVQHGWYENRFVRDAGHWKIGRLRQRIVAVTGDPHLLDLGAARVAVALRDAGLA